MTGVTSVERTVRTADGADLAATYFLPRHAPSTVMIVNSAMAVPRSFYRQFAGYLAEHGCAAVTYDYRGIGDSLAGHPRGDGSRLYQWGEHDFGAVVEQVERDYPDARLIVAGHSVGSQIVGMSTAAPKLAGFVAIASQSGYWKNWHGTGRLMMFALWHLVLPVAAKVAGYVPGFLFGSSASLPRHIALDWARFGRDPKYMRGAGRRASDAGYDRFAAPILAWHVSDDTYAPRAALDALLEFYPQAPKEVRTVTPELAGVSKIGHFGWFRPEGGQPSWDATLAWIAALPDI